MATQDFPDTSFLLRVLPFFLILGAIYIIYLYLSGRAWDVTSCAKKVSCTFLIFWGAQQMAV